LIDIKDFVGSQCVAWIKRSHFLDDSWKQDLFYYTYGNPFNIRQKHFNKNLNPILHNIGGHAEKFIFNFSVEQENFRKIHIFDNPCITFDANRPHFLKRSFFTNEEWRDYGQQILNLTMDKILNLNNSVKTLNEFTEISGITVTPLKYNKIAGLARSSVSKYAKNDKIGKKTDTVQNFLMRIKKGSKRIRRVLEGKSPTLVTQNIYKFAELTNNFINADESRLLNSSWGYGYLQNSLRSFIFKLHNNILGINSRVSHFVRGHPRTCTFCDLVRNPDENDETIFHLFYDCPSVEPVITEFFSMIFNSARDRFVSRHEYFVCFALECEKKNKLLHLVNLLVKYFIWECKIRFSLPTFNSMKKFVCLELSRILTQNRQIRNLIAQSGLTINEENDFRIHF